MARSSQGPRLMDIGTAGALASIRSDLRRVETMLGARLHQVEGRIEAAEGALRTEIREAPAAALAEEACGELRRVAARLTALEAKIDGLLAGVSPPACEESTYDLSTE